MPGAWKASWCDVCNLLSTTATLVVWYQRVGLSYNLEMANCSNQEYIPWGSQLLCSQKSHTSEVSSVSHLLDVPGGAVDESTCQCRGQRFDPWSRNIPHAKEQLSPCATTDEPVLWSPRAAANEPVCCNY